MNDLLAAAQAHAAELAAIAEKERASEAETIAWCAQQKQPMTHGYWEDRWLAEQKLKTAEALVEALTV